MGEGGELGVRGEGGGVGEGVGGGQTFTLASPLTALSFCLSERFRPDGPQAPSEEVREDIVWLKSAVREAVREAVRASILRWGG